LPLGGVPGHQHDHRLAQNVEGAHAHVTEGSRGAIVPRRRPAPEGGSAAAPASSWRRRNAQEKGISSRGFCSPCVEEGGELKNEGKAPVRKLGNGGRSGGAPAGGARLLRASGTRTCSSTSLMSPWRTQESRKKSGGANPSPVATNSRRRRGTEVVAPVELVLECMCWCAAGAKGSAGARARV
jgi:hypothetical protein